MTSDVDYVELHDIATVTINRPEVYNALREQTMHELIAAFDRAENSEAVRVIVLTGAGQDAFSTGGDVNLEAAFDTTEGHRMARLLIRLGEAVRTTGKPVIARIRGWCVGGGNELNLMCDLAVAADTARFAQTDAQIGSSPIWFGTQLLPQFVGTRRAKEILMLGEHVTAPEAARLGWINRAVPEADVDDAVGEWCDKLLSKSPQALRLTKMSVDYSADLLLPSVRHGFEVLTQMYDTAEFREGTAAFLEKRPPVFSPRQTEIRR